MIVLLILIYLAFISLGLPDSILGPALPRLLYEFNLPLSAGSLLSTVIISSAIISTFLSSYVVKILGTGVTVFLSCLITGGALLGFSYASSFFLLVLLGIPLGFGGGSVDAALNSFVALHYKAHHMNWLHSFWSLGATIGPVIMSFSLAATHSWRAGYFSIAAIQLSLAVLFFTSLHLWSTHKQTENSEGNRHSSTRNRKNQKLWKIRGISTAIIIMMLYCTVETAIGLWGSSYFVGTKKFTVDNSARLIAYYFGGITIGRLSSGFLSFRLNNTQLIRFGLIIVFTGILCLYLVSSPVLNGIVIVLIGFGLAPVFPSMLHETPNRFGKENSQILIGFQMGFAYIGSVILSPGIGIILQITHTSYFPLILLFATATLILLFEILIKKTMNPIPNQKL